MVYISAPEQWTQRAHVGDTLDVPNGINQLAGVLFAQHRREQPEAFLADFLARHRVLRHAADFGSTVAQLAAVAQFDFHDTLAYRPHAIHLIVAVELDATPNLEDFGIEHALAVVG